MDLPETIDSVEQLDDLMTRPSPAVISAISGLSGDLMILGAGGKMGPSLATLAKRAVQSAGIDKRVVAVSRFSDPAVEERLLEAGVETISCDLLAPGATASLPEMPNVVYMVGTKFGTRGNEPVTWATNAYLTGVIADKFRDAKIVLFSTGNVYPLVEVESGGSTETDAEQPVGEYARSALARERILQYFSEKYNIPAVIFRLNYAVDLRYGVLLDVARKIWQREPLDLTMGHVNVIWQGDAGAIALRAFEHVQNPPLLLNVTGPDVISIRDIACWFGEHFHIKPTFKNSAARTALLSDASQCERLFGKPPVDLNRMLRWTAHWLKSGGKTLDKPTHYEIREGTF